MLIRITEYGGIDERKLMDVYAESNYENTDYFFPDMEDKEAAAKQVEAGFLEFLKNDFFNQAGAAYWVLEKEGLWVSALRTSLIEPGLYYMEALETRPDCRKKGHAAELLREVTGHLKEEGSFRLCCRVSKRNIPSLKTHLKCGFRIVSEEGLDYLSGERDDRDYGLEYRHEAGERQEVEK